MTRDEGRHGNDAAVSWREIRALPQIAERGPCVYLSSAGATIRTSSSVSIGGRASDLGVTILWSAWATEKRPSKKATQRPQQNVYFAPFIVSGVSGAEALLPENNFSRAGRARQRRVIVVTYYAPALYVRSIDGLWEFDRERSRSASSLRSLCQKAIFGGSIFEDIGMHG